MTGEPPPADDHREPAESGDRSEPATVGIGHVDGDARNVIVGDNGVIHHREDIHWHFTQERVRRGPVLLARADEGQLQRLFVVPRGWEQARQELVGEQTVLIAGAPHTGRRTAAWCLLASNSAGDSREVQTIVPESDELQPPFDSEEIVAGDRLIVDLSSTDDSTFARAEDALGVFLSTVVDRGATAVVLMPWDGDQVRPDLRRRTRTVDRPDGFAVLRRHFAYHGLPAPDENHLELREVVDEYGIGEIARLAELAVVARRRAPGPGWKWLHDAVAVVRNRDRDAGKLVQRTVGDPGGRALLMAVSLFQGGYTETVSSAANRLHAIMSPDVEQTPVFVAPGFGERLASIDAEIDVEGRVRFTGLDTAAALRTHFWTHFPDAREKFRTWVVECGPYVVADGIVAPDVVRWFVDQLLRVRRRDDVFRVVKSWAEGRRAVTGLASTALEHGLADPTHGWAFRRQCYDWARTAPALRGAISSRLADLLVAACREVIGRTHPEQAIVRLRYLAAHQDERVAANAREALEAVVVRWPDRLRHLLLHLDGGTGGQQRRSDARTFLSVVEPGRLVERSTTSTSSLLDRSTVRTRVIERWRDAWHLGPDHWEGALHRWFAAAQTTSDDRILAVVAESTEGQSVRPGDLERTAERWAAAQGTSIARTVFDRFLGAVDDVFVDGALRAADEMPHLSSAGPHVSEEWS